MKKICLILTLCLGFNLSSKADRWVLMNTQRGGPAFLYWQGGPHGCTGGGRVCSQTWLNLDNGLSSVDWQYSAPGSFQAYVGQNVQINSIGQLQDPSSGHTYEAFETVVTSPYSEGSPEYQAFIDFITDYINNHPDE